jgi:hypothetical protein
MRRSSDDLVWNRGRFETRMGHWDAAALVQCSPSDEVSRERQRREEMARDPLSSLESLAGSSSRIEGLARRSGIDVKWLDQATGARSS